MVELDLRLKPPVSLRSAAERRGVGALHQLHACEHHAHLRLSAQRHPGHSLRPAHPAAGGQPGSRPQYGGGAAVHVLVCDWTRWAALNITD